MKLPLGTRTVDSWSIRWQKAAHRLNQWAPWILLGFVVLELGLLVYYQFVVARVSFNSDAAGVNLFAEEMLRSRSLLPPSWQYVDGLPVLQNQLYALFFLPFLANSFLVHALTGLVNTAVLGGVIYWFAWKTGLSALARTGVMAIVFSGISYYVSFNLFGHGYYGSMITWYLLILGLVISAALPEAIERLPKNGAKYALTSALVLILTTLVCMGGRRPVVVFSAPLLGSLALLVLLTRPQGLLLKRIIQQSGIVGLGTGLGFFSYTWLNNHLSLFLAKESEGFASQTDLINNLHLIWIGLLDLVGALPGGDTSLVSLSSAVAVCKFFFFGFILILPVILVLRLPRLQNLVFRFLVLYTVVNLTLTLYFLLFSRVLVDTSSLRYFLYQLVLHILVFGFFLEQYWFENRQLLKTTYLYPFLFLGCILPLGVSAVDLYTNPRSQRIMDEFGREIEPADTNPLEVLSDFLAETEVSYGYATYWNAGATTVLTDSRVLIRQIDLVDGLPVPNLWLGSSDWYLPEQHTGPSCLVLTEEERDHMLDRDKLESYLSIPEVTYQVGKYTIYVYDFNLAEKLPWSEVR